MYIMHYQAFIYSKIHEYNSKYRVQSNKVKSNMVGVGENFDKTKKSAACTGYPSLPLNSPHIPNRNAVIYIFEIQTFK